MLPSRVFNHKSTRLINRDRYNLISSSDLRSDKITVPHLTSTSKNTCTCYRCGVGGTTSSMRVCKVPGLGALKYCRNCVKETT